MKRVLFTQRVEVVESYGERRDCVDQRIVKFLGFCGYLPIPVPNHEKYAAVMVDDLKPRGIVLTGGNSLAKYGGNAPERDETDRILIEIALKQNIPLYGICRGMQSILDFFCNKLVEIDHHVALRHVVRGVHREREVNSYHNLGCTEIDSGELKVIYRSGDGVIEMVRHENKPMIGTMWHPERESCFSREDVSEIQGLLG